jgi:hypothetical protein
MERMSKIEGGLMDKLLEVALGWLPTTPAKVALLLTVPLSIVPFLLPEFVFPDRQLTEAAQIWLLQLLGSGTVLLIGSLAILGLVLHEFHRPSPDLADALRRARERVKDQEKTTQEPLQAAVRDALNQP